MLHRPIYRFLGEFLKKYDRRKLASKILMSDSFDYSIKHANYVNSRSLMFACDIHPKSPQSSTHVSAYLTDITSQFNKHSKFTPERTSSVYIPSDQIVEFANLITPQIDRPFILVTGDNDLSINKESLGNCLQNLLDNPLVVAWYAQNRDHDHPKLHSLPIGINIHNQWTNPLQWGGGFILPAFQELQLKTIAEAAEPLNDREAKIFCNWHFSLDRADRRALSEVIDKSICFFQTEPMPMSDTWELQARYQFVLSPHGVGLDCHRTWEALIIGCIPIVKAAKLNDLFADLPVIVVQDWQQITPAFLTESLRLMQSKAINTEKLLMSYWRGKLRYLS
jgi:hypothetical protein